MAAGAKQLLRLTFQRQLSPLPCRGHPLMSPPCSSHLHLEPLCCSGALCGTQLEGQICVVLTGIFCQVFCKLGESCLAAVIKGVLMLPGRQISCNSLSFLEGILGQEPLWWQGTSSLRYGREGTKCHTGVLVGAATQQDLWLKESNILSSATQNPSILNNFTFSYINSEIPSLSPQLEGVYGMEGGGVFMMGR